MTLTQGYWLADTACTQALWQAVMGHNPSHFNSAHQPVENVSWNDVEKFLQRTKPLAPELNLTLPTEAQWEYACRASTQTPFAFGQTIDSEQVNFNGNFPYGDGEKSAYRKQTVVVKSLPVNPWGLYEMHGNVWEWCADWHGRYPAQLCTDPEGPETGEARVMRGGGWFAHARRARSASRRAGTPVNRYADIGLRLARGPSPPGASKKKA